MSTSDNQISEQDWRDQFLDFLVEKSIEDKNTIIKHIETIEINDRIISEFQAKIDELERLLATARA